MGALGGGSLVAFAGFTVTRDGERLRIRRGLLQRTEAALPVRRVHAVRVVEGVLRRPFGLAALRVEVAGYAEEAAAARTLFPLLRRAEVEPFLAALLPELADDPGGLEPPPARAARRYVLPPDAGRPGRSAARPACSSRASAPWPLLLAPLLALDGWLDYRAAGWRLRDGRLAMRSRRLARSTLLTPAARLQQHSIAQSPLQRRAAARRPRGRGRQGRPRAGPPPRAAGRRRAVGTSAAMTRAFYFDIGSPYVYLTIARLPLDDVEWKPISLGGLWKQSGGGSWALTDRRAEGIAEIEARAERYGLPPIRWPVPWPGRYLSAMRACLVAAEEGVGEEFARIASRMGFAEGRDLSEMSTVWEAGVRAGLDPLALNDRIGSPEIKQRLIDETEAAYARGVRGVPTLDTGDELLWGDDKILVDPEPVEQRVVGAPRPAHADRQVEVHAHADRVLELAARRGPDRLDHRAAAADEDALLGLGLDPQQRVDLDEVVALDDLVDLDLDRVRDLLARAVQHLLAHELGQPHVLGLVGDLLEREQERALGRELDEVLDERADALAAGGGDREHLAVEAEVGGRLERLRWCGSGRAGRSC